jgi:hypothetical protein
VNISCFGSNNGSIDVTVLLGTPNFSYAWDNGATTEDLSNLSPGTYRFVLTDGNGCKTSSSYTITAPSQLNATVLTSTANSSNNGSIDLSVSGGTPAYTYLWNTNETSEDLSNLAAGNYSVTVTDANGCQTIVNAEVMVESTNALIDQENNEWMIYPNPTDNDATIEWGNNDVDELIITDSNGKIMSRNTVVNENNYKVQNLSSGIYFVSLYQLNEKIGSRKLIVL